MSFTEYMLLTIDSLVLLKDDRREHEESLSMLARATHQQISIYKTARPKAPITVSIPHTPSIANCVAPFSSLGQFSGGTGR